MSKFEGELLGNQWKFTVAPFIFLVMGSIGIALSIRSLFVGGIGWDSTFDTYATTVARGIDGSSTLKAAYDAIPVTTEFYGLIVYQLAEFFHTLFTGSGDPLGAYDPSTYIWQGGVTLLLAVFAATTLAFSVWIVWRSLFVATFTWATLVTLPNWLGASTINYKDMPVASGLTILSAGLGIAVFMAANNRASRSRKSIWLFAAAIAIAAIGSSVSIGTRAGALFIVVGIIAFTLVVSAGVAWRIHSRQVLLVPLVVGIFAVVTPIAFLWLTNPVARISLPYWLKDSLDYSTGEFPWTLTMRSAGLDVANNALPWWYIPSWLFARLPLVVFVLALVGLIAGIVTIAVPRFRTRSLLILTPFVAQGLLIPMGLILLNSTLYDEIRHLQFMYPAVILIGAYGVYFSITYGISGFVRIGTQALAVAVVLVNLYWVFQWYPYSYAFVNPIAKGTPVERNWDLDYWGVSAREGVEKLEELGYQDIVVVPHGEPGRPFGGQNLGDPGGGVIDTGFTPTPGKQFAYYWFERFSFPFSEYDCKELFVIERVGKTLGHGGVCTPN